MWRVTIYRDNHYSIESYSKHFKTQEDAEDFFSDEIRQEFDEEIETGVMSDQEIQDIINSAFYTFEDDEYQVNISLELASEEEDNDYI